MASRERGPKRAPDVDADSNHKIAKIRTGIDGFDDISGGGLPRNQSTLVVGGPGSGKTVFALQTLVEGYRQWGEPGIFVTFEEDSTQVIANVASFGWDVDARSPDRLLFLDARPDPELVQAGDFDIRAVLAIVQAKAKDMGARRVVFDGLDMLLDLLGDRAAERRELDRLHRWLRTSGMTGIITAKAVGQDSALIERYSYLQFMADCVVVFYHRVSSSVSVRGLRIDKYRGSDHSANEYPLIISPEGMRVARYNPGELIGEATSERVATGIPALDEMSGGGYFKGSCVLITGAPGTAKTTLAGSFTEAVCNRGERCLYISFDEPAPTIVRNLRSVCINVEPYVASGLLRIYSIRTAAFSAEAHLIHFQDLIDQHHPSCMVIDPISALAHAGGTMLAIDATVRLIDLAKARNITLICTSMTTTTDTAVEESLGNISTVADVWIHLSYLIRAGERNRALTIVKVRGSKHSNQVRELLLSDDGVTLADISTIGGEVLMGTARWEQEEERLADELRATNDIERRRRELVRAEADLKARIEAIEREVQERRADRELLEEDNRLGRVGRTHSRAAVLRKRAQAPENPETNGSN